MMLPQLNGLKASGKVFMQRQQSAHLSSPSGSQLHVLPVGTMSGGCGWYFECSDTTMICEEVA